MLSMIQVLVSLGKDHDTGYQPFIKNASGEDMGALGISWASFGPMKAHKK